MESQLHTPTEDTGFLRRIALSYRAGLFIVLLAALLTHLPTSFGSFSTDDYLIRANTVGDAALYSHGFAKADPDKPLWRSLLDGFHFYTPDAGTLAAYREYGNLPWWTADRATMNPFRPVAAFTHWLDFQIAPDSFSFQSFHTLLCATIVAPGRAQVVPLEPEFIRPQDGHDKQDCESRAVRRWCSYSSPSCWTCWHSA